MKRFGFVLVALVILAIVLPVTAVASTADNPYVTNLVSGRKLADIGDVKVWNDAGFLYVEYKITEPDWYLFGTHVEVKTNWTAIGQAQGNAVPGRFTYKQDHEFADSALYKIPITWPVGTQLQISTHAETGNMGGSTADVCASLPAAAQIQQLYPGTLGADVDVLVSGGTSLDGLYPGWCANPDMNIYTGWTYLADVYCSLGSVPAGLVIHPENFDLVNWLINQDYVGQGASTWTVQTAIWNLLCSYPVSGQAATIVAAAQANGEGFSPGCDQLVAILLAPKDPYTNELRQPLLIPKPVPCTEINEETAWGNGLGFPGSDWSMYFGYTLQR